MKIRKLLPDVNDPKLWMVKCMQTGQEVNMAISMALKVASMQLNGETCPVTACFANPNLRGYVYVEAHKEVDVGDFVRSFRPLANWGISLVPMTEMDRVFESALRQA